MVYFRPENLVSTEWMQNNINNPQIRIAEVNYDPSNYYQDCMPNVVLIDWKVLYLNR